MKKDLLNKLPKIKISPKFYLKFPDSAGVYIYIKEGKPIYVGKAKNLKNRVSSYFRLNLDTKTRKMINEAEEISYIKVASEFESLLLEAKLIKYYQPKYNIIAKDDKQPLYIRITKEKFPRIITLRKNDLSKTLDLATYGPFPSTGNVRSVLRMIRSVFPYSDHKLGKKACLYSQIGLCNPCPNVIQSEYERKIYLSSIRHIKSMLDGKIKKVKKDLEREMRKASKLSEFENAALIRDKIKKLEYITNPQSNVDIYLENPNLVEDTRKNEILDLKHILQNNGIVISKLVRIECYDVAHLQGVSPTASMVVFMGGVPEKSYYRHFKINQKKGWDDYGSLREVAKRRKKHLSDWGRPDLIIVDGGKGQTSVFLREFETENIPVVGLAKRFESLVIPINNLGTTEIIEYRLLKGASLNLVQRLRNEAHRFARVYHHKLLSKSLFDTQK